MKRLYQSERRNELNSDLTEAALVQRGIKQKYRERRARVRSYTLYTINPFNNTNAFLTCKGIYSFQEVLSRWLTNAANSLV